MSTTRKRSKRRRASAPGKASQQPRGSRASGTSRLRRNPLWVGALVALGLLGLIGAFTAWARRAGPGSGTVVVIDLPPRVSMSEIGERLAARGLVRSASTAALYLRVAGSRVIGGKHLLRDDLSLRDLAQRLARSPNRPHVRVVVPEGYQHRQIAARLAEQEVCGAQDFVDAVFDEDLMRDLHLRGPSSEGFLFPATYQLAVDSDPKAVVRQLVGEARRRLARLSERYPGAMQNLAKVDGFDEHDIVTLASIVEREAADPAELPLIASVFFNRLHDPTFRPLRMLESDPTAAYGCLVQPWAAPSCADFHGQVTPAMLRDAENLYNTYRHPGVPPGPIANPGEAALTAVLAPARSDYLYFVASGHGHHTFSKTFEEHKRVMGH